MSGRLVLFDLDNTLLAGDSDFEWAQFLIEQGVLDREVYEARNQTFYDQYKAGTLDIHEFLDFQLKPLSRHPRAQLDAWHREFMERKIRPMIRRAGARAGRAPPRRPARRDHRHQQLRHRADRARVRDRAPDRDRAGAARRRVHRAACPASRAFARARSRGSRPGSRSGAATLASFAESWFYSDSLNDLPLLERVTHPVAVDPDETLRAHAERSGWPIISLDDLMR